MPDRPTSCVKASPLVEPGEAIVMDPAALIDGPFPIGRGS